MFNETNPTHVWKFFRAGGLDQVRLESAADLANLANLDPKLWVALACPTRGLEFDARTLDFIDTDKDGRIRVPEILAAVQWATQQLKNPADLVPGNDALPLTAINDALPEGKAMLASAREILRNLGKADAPAITVADLTDTAKIFAATKFNGDGIVPPASAANDSTKKIIEDIITTLGGEADRSGVPGVSLAKVEHFFTAAQAHADWWAKTQTNAAILPLGEATHSAFTALKAIRAKVDDYFSRVRLAAFDARAAAPLNRAETEFATLALKDLSSTAQELAGFPLARIEAGRALPLAEGVNPAWTTALKTFHSSVVTPLLGVDKTMLTADEWTALTARFTTYETWLGEQVGASVEKLGLPRLQEILATNARIEITALIAQDQALETEMTSIVAVEKLVRYHRDLHLLLRNFVNFSDFYTRGQNAIFRVGTLYLDGRSCDLCIRVEDLARHGAMAGLSGSYLAYCECTRKATNEKMTIAAAFTAGDSDNLMVGRNGVFYDRQGRDWDATIVKIVDNPISIGQAFWTPYKKLVRFIEEQITKRAATADAAANERLTGAVTKAGTAADTGKTPPSKPTIDTGVIAALGVAAAGLGGMIGGVVSGFLSLGPWMPLGAVGIIFLISGPSMVLAWLKLRKRNLAPLLDANGWAVNGRVKINLPLGAALTKTAQLPLNSERSLEDLYPEDTRGRTWAGIILGLLLAGILATIYYWSEISAWKNQFLTPPPASAPVPVKK